MTRTRPRSVPPCAVHPWDHKRCGAGPDGFKGGASVEKTRMALVSVLHALLLFLPAYVANMSPVLVAKLVPGWKAPIDGGRLGKDGKRLLGPGKTWRGLVGGTLLGAVTAAVVAI